MKKHLRFYLLPVALVSIAALANHPLPAADLVHAKDGSGVYGYNDTPVLPWCGFRVHDADRPVPRRVDPGPALAPAPAPADAVILFDGKDLSKWQASDYQVVEGCIVAGDANFTTKDTFGSFQLHLEWMGPAKFEGPWYNQGNNGVFLHGLYEIQIFDSYTEKIYPDGMAGAVYGQTPPLVNVCRKPGEWQSFDILFTAPKFADGKLTQPARVTVLQNGVVVQLNQEIHGGTNHRTLPEYKQKASEGPIALGGHHCPVRFRNLWIRRL